jgi:hypothetical protein
VTAKILHVDLTALRYCNRGSRQFFERHGLNWALFLQEGVDMEAVEKIDDEMAKAVVRQAKLRQGIA